MQQAFLIIISLLGAIYALVTKKAKIALGLLILGISFGFAIPNLAKGIWTDVLGAISLILFALGVLVMVWPKKKAPVENSAEEKPEKEIENKYL